MSKYIWWWSLCMHKTANGCKTKGVLNMQNASEQKMSGVVKRSKQKNKFDDTQNVVRKRSIFQRVRQEPNEQTKNKKRKMESWNYATRKSIDLVFSWMQDKEGKFIALSCYGVSHDRISTLPHKRIYVMQIICISWMNWCNCLPCICF